MFGGHSFREWVHKCEKLLEAEEKISQEGASQTEGHHEQHSKTTTAEQKEKAEEAKVLGNQAVAKRNWAEAIKHYGVALSLDPTNPIYFSNRSMAYAQQGNWESALSDAEQAVCLQSQWAKAYFRLATALIGLNRFAEAAAALRRGLECCNEPRELGELNSLLLTADRLTKLEQFGLKQLGTLGSVGNYKDIIDIIDSNLACLGQDDFGKAMASVTVTVGSTFRCMRQIVIDAQGRIIHLSAPNPFVPGAQALTSQLTNGTATLIHVFVHASRVDGHQEYQFEARPQKQQSGGVSQFGSAFPTKPLTDRQTAILAITAAQANSSPFPFNACLAGSVASF
eukprot:TRINITY_DN1954_c0_g1_i3.p1 TRINITY_DN1954_c0_g1~~TRINITY_DN1954_c0_g1_i3.p1  ORF type:complete len:339 (+),score=45.19 TRINITY_DN1954_c0_g1_i3:63-1079(+)